jgi:predicted dehydrogenase
MAVIGVGHFGQFHAEKISALDNATLVGIADTNVKQARKIAKKHGAEAVPDFRDLFGRIDAACVVVPTRFHYEVASACLENGIHVLVEKPITDELESAKKLVALSIQHERVLQVGHLVRFSGVVEALRRQIKRPLYIDSVRIAPYKPRGTDVNVILDLMVHDLDLILSLVDAPLVSLDAAGAPVISPSEDIASARLKFANGCIANITASRISLKTERKMRIFEPDTYVTVDFDAQRIRTLRKGKGSLLPGIPKIDNEEQQYDEGDALEQEISSFVDAIASGRAPVVSGEDGVKALEAALQVNESLRAHLEFVRQVDMTSSGDLSSPET